MRAHLFVITLIARTAIPGSDANISLAVGKCTNQRLNLWVELDRFKPNDIPFFVKVKGPSTLVFGLF